MSSPRARGVSLIIGAMTLAVSHLCDPGVGLADDQCSSLCRSLQYCSTQCAICDPPVPEGMSCPDPRWTTCGEYGAVCAPDPGPFCPHWERRERSGTFVYEEGFVSGTWYCKKAYSIATWEEDICTGARRNERCQGGHYETVYGYRECQFWKANSVRVC